MRLPVRRSPLLTRLLPLLAAVGCAAPPPPAAVSAEPLPPASSAADLGREPAAPHPLDPLRPDEIEAVSAALAADGRLPAGALFPLFVLDEPPKAAVLARAPGAPPPPRRARVVVLDRRANRSHEALVDVNAAAIVSWRELPGVQPALTASEFEEVPAVVRADPRWQAALRRRGIEDPGGVQLDVWAPGHLEPAWQEDGRRLARVLAFWRGAARDGYDRPIEGLIARVDLNAMRVVAVDDEDPAPLPPPSPGPRAGRRPLPPLVTELPRGPGFRVRGQEVSWEGWRLRWALHPREGLVLYQVTHRDGERRRPVLYRGALSEVVVPYGDPAPAWRWRSAFDEGEYGLGRSAFGLAPRADAPSHALLLDAVLADDRGAPVTVPQAVAIYERDGGLLWRHHDEDSGRLEARRARELVLGMTLTIGNYDYGLAWVLRQDGSLSLEVELTGLLLARAVAPRRCGYCPDLERGRSPAPEPVDTRFGTLVAPGVLAPNHQHVFCARLDLDVDGPLNSVLEAEAAPAPAGPDNPLGQAFTVERTLLTSERAARRDLDPLRSRRWKVFNPGSPTALGHLPGYTLVPGENGAFLPLAGAPIRTRAGFAAHHVWATRHHEDELYAAGEHPNQAREPDGLPRYAADDEPLVGQDVVLWYTFATTHAPRVEEWPIMSVHRTGFRLVPDGFFEHNPGLDVPAPE